MAAYHHMTLMLWNHDGLRALCTFLAQFLRSFSVIIWIYCFASLIIIYISDAGGRQRVLYKDLSLAFSSSLITRLA